MIRSPGDKTPPPPGGRAAERLRMFEEARQPAPARAKSGPAGKKATAPKAGDRAKRRRTRREEQD
jgi:hypothetical protein